MKNLMEIAYCIYSFSPPEFDRVKIVCVIKDKDEAGQAMAALSEAYPEAQYLMEPVLFYP